VSREAPLIQAILDDPDDNTIRLVYADWLEEHGDAGDAARGEFIRVQIALTQIDEDDPRCLALYLREQELLEEHQQHWISELPEGMRKRPLAGPVFRRGFVSRVSVTFDAFLTRAEQLYATTPVEHVHISEMHHVADLAACPWLARLERLDLSQNPVTPEHLTILLQSPHLPPLTEVYLGGHQLGADGAERLTRSPRMATVRHLELEGRTDRWGRINTDGARALASSPHLGELRHLLIGGNGIGDAGAAALAESSAFPRLVELALNNSDLTADGVGALARSPHRRGLEALNLGLNGAYADDDMMAALREGDWPCLVWLALHSDRVTNEGLTLLAAAALPALQSLNLKWNAFDAAGLRSLAASPLLARVRRLALSDNQIGDAGALALSRAAGCFRPRMLELQKTGLGDAGLTGLADSGLLDELRVLDLSENEIGDAGVIALAGRRLPWLHGLALHKNRITAAGAAGLAGAPWLAQLLDLDLYSNHLGDQGVAALAASPHLARVQKLTLGNNDIGDAGAIALARSPYVSRLLSLELSGNCLTDAGALALADSPSFAKLRHVNLFGSALGDATLRRLLQCFDSVGFDDRRMRALRAETQ
jgi:uncharacterized protein (TIGR02996 family)